MYTRRVLAGEYIVANKYLINDLIGLELWDDNMRQMLMAANGSVLNLPIPTELKELYKTVWEMSMKNIIDMSADRGIFIDQSQSLNLFMQDADYAKLTSMHFYGWKKGLKTGMYYLRTKSAVNAIQFTLDKGKIDDAKEVVTTKLEIDSRPQKVEPEPMSAEEYRAFLEESRRTVEDEDEDCLMCGS